MCKRKKQNNIWRREVPKYFPDMNKSWASAQIQLLTPETSKQVSFTKLGNVRDIFFWLPRAALEVGWSVRPSVARLCEKLTLLEYKSSLSYFVILVVTLVTVMTVMIVGRVMTLVTVVRVVTILKVVTLDKKSLNKMVKWRKRKIVKEKQ